MTAFIISIIAVSLFAAVLYKTAVLLPARALLATSMAGISTILDSELDDDCKERAVRIAALSLFQRTWQIFWRLALSVVAAAAPLFIADFTGIVSFDVTLGLMLRFEYILFISLSAIAIGALIAWWTNQNSDKTVYAALGVAHAYNMGDRLVHMLAFASPKFQRASCALDDCLFSRAIALAPENPPIFITSLARGGTTALLNAFHQTPQIAVHEYRDMPFVTSPMLWSMLSSSRKVARRKRAHGDGIEIDIDSPEAFEEVLWRLYWPEKYMQKSISIWQQEDEKGQAREVLLRHFRKIILLRHHTRAKVDERARYMSKNNANIGRLRLLKTMFPACEVIVPLRRPGAHAASLLRQHQNFTDQQSRDEFIRRYMRDIGHFEFGLLHRPIAFEAFMPGTLGPETGDYWLLYWIAAFEEVRDKGQYCHIVTQDSLRAEPRAVMTVLCKRLGLATGNISFENFFRSGFDVCPNNLFSPELLRQADSLYDSLACRAVL